MATSADFIDALRKRDRAVAVVAARALLDDRAALGDQWRSIAQFAATVGEWSVAIAAMRRFIDAGPPRDLERSLALADMLTQAGRIGDAVRVVEPLTASATRDARLWHLLGTARIELGHVEAGREDLNKAASLRPGSGMTWLAIAGATDYRTDTKALKVLHDASSSIGHAPEQRAPYLYALGKAMVDRNDNDLAFGAFAEGARLARPLRQYDASIDLASARELRQKLPRSVLETPAGQGSASNAPIFVTGLPRSGTTLVEQMLASHSAVRGGGEANLLGLVADLAGGAGAGATRALIAAPSARERLRAIRHYYLHLAAERQPGTGRFIDKSLNTSRFAALVHLALPNSAIIWLRRDPLDMAWSAFSTYFARGVGWSFDLKDLAAHFAAEDLLFEHWRDALGDRILAVPYDGLTADFAHWSAKILNHAGLAMESQVLEFHRTKRAVSTASVAQVRRPVYRHAVGRAEPWRDHLAPFLEAYATRRAELGLEL